MIKKNYIELRIDEILKELKFINTNLIHLIQLNEKK